MLGSGVDRKVVVRSGERKRGFLPESSIPIPQWLNADLLDGSMRVGGKGEARLMRKIDSLGDVT